MSAPVITFSGVRVRYPNGAHALRGVDLNVNDGECVAVVGESGSGKTTLARTVMGLLPAGTVAEGSIMVDGTSLLDLSPDAVREMRGLRVGYVPQDPFASFDPLRRVAHHLTEAWSVHGRRPPPGWEADALAGLGITDAPRRARQWPHQWSGGMLQRATIVAATAHHPLLTVADEPTSAVDADLADDILRMCVSRSRSVLLFSHDLALVARHADRVVVLYAGAVVETGAAERVMTDPVHPYSRALLAATPVPGHGLPPSLDGEPPDTRAIPAGCAFHPRCPVAVDRCRVDPPALVDGVACWVERPR